MDPLLVGKGAAIFELGLSVFGYILAGLVFLRYREKRKRSTLYLAVFFVLAVTGILCSCVSRFLVYYFGFTGVENYVVALFVRDHLALVFLTLGYLFLQVFSWEFLGTREAHGKNAAFVVFGLLIAGFLFWTPFDPDDPIHMIMFVLVAIYCCFVCVPISRESLRARRKIDDPAFRFGFAGLTLMCLGLIFMLVCFALDQTLMIVTGWQFNPFYWMGWSVGLLSLVGGYLGILLPKWVRARLHPEDALREL